MRAWQMVVGMGPVPLPTTRYPRLQVARAAWRVAAFERALLSMVGPSLLAATLAFLPEALHLRVAARGRRVELRGEVLSLRVAGMGCTACTAKVQCALEMLPAV